jgi:hypothetical protein
MLLMDIWFFSFSTKARGGDVKGGFLEYSKPKNEKFLFLSSDLDLVCFSKPKSQSFETLTVALA